MSQPRPPFLFGEHELTLDEKHRILIPASIRNAINVEDHGDAFFGLIGVNRRIWMYPDKFYQDKLELYESEMTPQEELVDYAHLNFSMADRYTVDKQGRMLLDQKLIERTSLTREITLIGARDHIEIWPRAAWRARFSELLGQPNEVARKARAVREAKPEA